MRVCIEGKRKRYRNPKAERIQFRRLLNTIIQVLREHKGNYEFIETITQ
jgi:hypothetical protein